ncbi:dihydroorotate dehydrogenase electron transfer subunit [Jatrophihabitans endophyticus]|uniref:Dihydroorotate dehydrogenase electron transfer subunit n=1 Tax=Jatrophihabitans endophyticus TaxID=1206085 RepID=A0A1M5LPC8_9ACTN|nr:dihydroorotate dehydrogenase electron transfer subunit [Jatrophihabitans endophyticus]SHG66937.1 dihydroorotate dehydrogenase electron transfer subunit [Jatrophihabitans endophyticus]
MSVVQEQAEIFSVTRAGEYFQFTVIAPRIAEGFRPGHFVAVAVGGENSAMGLRRAFAIAGATPTGAFAGTVQFVVAEHGPGTRWLTQRRAGEVVDLVGPLGTPFPLPNGPAPAVLVGGGYGSAPLIPLAHALLAQGSPIEFVLGAATGSRLYGELTAKRTAGQVTVTTDDGSAGERGLVTDVLPAAIERINAEIVYACGPMPMLQAVGNIAQKHAIHAAVAVEEAMACGIGVCMTCVLPVRGDDGRTRLVRSCVEGPVFDAARVRWNDVGHLPADLVGADAMRGH